MSTNKVCLFQIFGGTNYAVKIFSSQSEPNRLKSAAQYNKSQAIKVHTHN